MMDGVFWSPQSSISSSETFQIDKSALVEVMSSTVALAKSRVRRIQTTPKSGVLTEFTECSEWLDGVEHSGQVMARQIQQWCEAKVVKDSEAPLTVELAVAPGIGSEG